MGQKLTPNRIRWRGVLTSVQPRIYLSRSFDQRSHSYRGYVLRVDGDIGGERRQFLVVVGKSAYAKHQFQVGDNVSGVGLPVADRRRETAKLYKVSQLKVHSRDAQGPRPPWHDIRGGRLDRQGCDISPYTGRIEPPSPSRLAEKVDKGDGAVAVGPHRYKR